MASLFVACLGFLVFALKCSSSFDASLDARWEKFKLDYKKSYSTQDEIHRRGIWESKLKEIKEHNEEADRGVHTYWLKETPWDDITYFEFMYNNTNFDEKRLGDGEKWKVPLGNCTPSVDLPEGLPESVDWTKLGYVTSVKDQGRCGSCWAHAVVGSLEGQWFRKTGQLISLSPQSLVDCNEENNGCHGGGPDDAFEFITENGIPSERDYPYKEAEGECKLSSTKVTARITGYNITYSEEDLLNSLVNIGPISIGISTGPKIQNYGRGVFNGCTGPRNHAVIVVGYGVHNGMKVWKIKNSYSKEWGLDGYFYLTRECYSACGLTDFATYPILDGLEYPNMEALRSVAFMPRISLLLCIGSMFLSVVATLC